MSVDQAVSVPAYQSLADELRVEITSGRLRPGERLPTEPQLCARSGLSRSTVREALRLLASQHLIVTTRGVTGGSFVARPSPLQLADSLTMGMDMLLFAGAIGTPHVLDAREMIEIPAAAVAALRRTDNDLAAMRACLHDAHVDEPRDRLAAHLRFHAAVAAATGNPLLELITRPLYGLAHDRELAGRVPLHLWLQTMADHETILGAIERQDPAAAMDACRVHLTTLRPMYAAAQGGVEPPPEAQGGVEPPPGAQGGVEPPPEEAELHAGGAALGEPDGRP